MNNRYLIGEAVGAGGMGSVFRTYDRLSGRFVALKQVNVADIANETQAHSTGASLDFRKALAQEFRLLASLRHPHIISVLDYGFDDNKHPYFTMELLENAPNILSYGRDKTLEEKQSLIRQTAEALYYLHRRGIIHRDVKPDNILVHHGVVKVLDFGLATVQRDKEEAQTVGTLAYMSPEVLAGDSIDSNADLYALGVIGFELLTGEYPFAYETMTDLVRAILERSPRLELLQVDEAWQIIIKRLLAKDPKDRYPKGYDLLQALGVQETATIRESFLQAAKFVGREIEFDQLTHALNEAMEGRGSLWLIGGESGVGKSRLVDELRTRAVVDGVMALRGQAVSEAAAPFTLFQDALRRLVLQTTLSDFEASVLATLVPDLSELVGYSVSPAPTIEPIAARNRLFKVIEDVFKRQEKPVLLVLEDLQWATDSLNVLKQLATVVHQLPILIVANYRDDERPQLPTELPQAKVIKLERLSHAAIADLSEAMLGERGRQEEVVELLNRETEGNIFFIVEVVRALAEEMGDLAQIGMRTLPQEVFAGGVQAVVKRRLSNVPTSALPLLKLAAIAGRRLDTRVLAELAPSTRIDSWLAACGSVLEVQEERWQFAHDKLREALLKGLGTDEAMALHGKVAQAMEAVYGMDERRAAALAYHYGKAQNTSKEVQFSIQAANYALKNSSYEATTRYLERALSLMPTDDALARADLQDTLGRTYLALSRMAESRQNLQAALIGFGYPTSNSMPVLIVSTLKHILLQARNRFRKPHTPALDSENVMKAAGIYEQLGEVYFFANELIPTANAALKSANLAEKAVNDSDALAIAYAGMGVMCSVIPLHRQAAHYATRAVEVGRNLHEPVALGWACYLSGVFYVGVGEWEKALTNLHEAIDIHKRIGDLRRWESCLGTASVGNTYQGLFETSNALSQQQYDSSIKRGDIQSILWSIYQLLQNRIGMNVPYEDLLQEAEHFIIRSPALSEKIYGYGLLAWAHERLGNQSQAESHAQTANRISAGISPLGFYTIAGYSGAAETFLSMWRRGDKSPSTKKAIHEALANLKRFSRIFPIGKTRALRCEGLLAELMGNREKALRLLSEAKTVAETMCMAYDARLAEADWARVEKL